MIKQAGFAKNSQKVMVLDRIESECARFIKRVKDAKKELTEDENAGYRSKKVAAVKRGAIDLKMALNEINEFPKLFQ